MSNEAKMVSPWVDYYRKVEALFALDNDVIVKFDDETYELKLYVDGNKKAKAIEKLMPAMKVFGNVTVNIQVYPSNAEFTDILDVIDEAFKDNPAFSFTASQQTPFGTFNYAVFAPKVVQYFNDDIGDINGKRSTLYQELAKEVFDEVDGIKFCTDITSSLNVNGYCNNTFTNLL